MMKQKRLMLLGGLRYLIPVIEAAHKHGYYVITCDYLPDNVAHRYSDEYCNVSIVDKEAVLAVAKEKKIDGIMSFAVDPGVVTAAYVQEKLGLPQAGPYESVCILQNKDRFRKFLSDNGFNAPKAKGYDNAKDALNDLAGYRFPIIVKPVDSAGSKGVTKVDSADGFESAFEYAKKHSISGRVIVEEFIEKQGCSSDSECFSVDGKLVYVSFSAQRFDDKAPNPYTPAAFSWPSTFTHAQEEELTSELQRLLSLLNMGTSIYNVETRIGLDGKPYIMEVSPRGGGNRLAEMIRFSTGTDLIDAAVCAAVGDEHQHIEQKPYKGYWAELILHSEGEGIFQGMRVDDEVKEYVVETDLWVNKGDIIHGFKGANNTIGTLVMKFDSEKELYYALEHQSTIFKLLDDVQFC